MNLNFVESSPIPVKASLALMGLCAETFRLPLCPPTDATREALRAALRELGLLVVSCATTSRERIEGWHALPATPLRRRGARRVRRAAPRPWRRRRCARRSRAATAGGSTPG